MENGNNPGVSAIFFDLDNTLIATRKADKITCNQLIQILWEKWTVPLDHASNACKTYLRSFRKCPENLSMSLDSWRRFLWSQALGSQYNKFAGEIYEMWLKLRYDYLAPVPETKSLLCHLRQHYFLGLITNGTSRAQWEKIDKLQLRTFFDIILVSGDLPWEKPHHKIFHEACTYLGVTPQQCIMVGDKLETDILGGNKANLGGTVWIPLTNSDMDSQNFNPDYVIEHVTKLPQLLPRNPKLLKTRGRNRANSTKRISLPDFEDSCSNSSDGS